MRRNIYDVLASEFDIHRIVRQLHDVPPHEVYEVHVDGRRAVCKIDAGPTGAAGTEGRVTAFVDEHTSIPVPEVLTAGSDHYVTVWHPDAPASGKEHEVDETWAAVAGRAMATLHEETDKLIHEYGRFRPQNGGVATTGYDDWHAAAIEYVRRHRSVADRHGHADIIDRVVAILDDHLDAFAGAGGPVCCHGWATPEHVSVTDDRVGCMLDFEHAIAAPGEFDYWRTVLPTFDHDTHTLRQAFRDGYESIRSLSAGFELRKPFYVLLNLIYYFESLYVQDQHGPEATAERAEGIRDSIDETLASLS